MNIFEVDDENSYALCLGVIIFNLILAGLYVLWKAITIAPAFLK